MLDGVNNMTGPFIGVMMGYGALLSLVLLVVLVLLTVWLLHERAVRAIAR